MGDWGTDGWAVAPGEGRRIDQGPSWLEVLVRGADVAGAMGVFVFTHPVIPQNPPHAHSGFAKILYVLEGEYQVRVGNAVFDAAPGTLVVVPRGSHHSFTTDTGGRILFVCAPSGNEEMFLEIDGLGPAATVEQLGEVMTRFGTTELPGEAGGPWGALSAS